LVLPAETAACPWTDPGTIVMTVLNSAAERKKLRRVLSRLDTIFFLISAMVVVDTIGAIAVGGGETFTWLVVLFVTFFIPSALISAELGAAIPEEGGAYVWVRRAFGRYAGALTSLLYWAGTPMWLGGSVAVVAMAVYQQFLGGLSLAGMYLFGAVFIGLATVAAIIPLRLGKWVPTSGAVGQIVLLAFFTLSVVLYGTQHGVHGMSAGDLSPSPAVFIAIVPVLLYSFVGVELPSTAAEEMTNPRRDIPVAIGRAGIGQALMYGIPILAVLIVLPAGQITSLRGLIDAIETVLTTYGGSVAADGTATLTGWGQLLGWACAAVFIWVLAASGAAWIMGAGRAQAAACLDGAGPRVLGRISPRSGVPVIMGLISGGISLLAMAAYLTVARGDNQKYFSAALVVSIALIVLAYLLIFPAFVALRLREPGLTRPFRVPGGARTAWLVASLATGWSLLAAVCLLWPGLGTADPDAALPAGFASQRGQFELLVLVPIGAVITVTTAYHLATRPMGRARRASPPPPVAPPGAAPEHDGGLWRFGIDDGKPAGDTLAER
jgi:glutamate:GABA antiporter